MTTVGSSGRGVLPAVLSIAGSDPSGGAGVQADLKTFSAFGVYGAAVITALTAQNASAVFAVEPVDAELVGRQLDAVFAERLFDAVKIGMLGTAAVARRVAESLRANSHENIVIDPVLRASAGGALLDDDGLRVIRDELLPLATVVTPNLAEAGALLGRPPATSVAQMHQAAGGLVALGARWAVVTGGHLDIDDECVDVVHGPGETHEIRSPRIPGPDRHGTGCTFSSAVAALLALGEDVGSACANAHGYVASAIAAANDAHLGTETSGPLYHILYAPPLIV